jgi:hypothetical protein
MGDDRKDASKVEQGPARSNDAEPKDDALPEVEAAARQEVEYPSDETDEG